MDPDYSITLPVQWGDEDSFGHVNNVVFFRWLESGRVAFMEQTGIMTIGERGRIAPILACASANYRRQLTYPDKVEVRTRVAKLGRSSITLEQEIRSESSGEIVADGSSVIVMYDYAANASVELPPGLRARLQQNRTGTE